MHNIFFLQSLDEYHYSAHIDIPFLIPCHPFRFQMELGSYKC